MPSVCRHSGLHHDHRAERDVKVDGDYRELLELVHRTLVQRRFRVDLGFQDGLLPRGLRCALLRRQ